MDRIVQFGTSPTRVGASNMQRLTLMPSEEGFDQGYHQSPDDEATDDHPALAGSPAFTLVGLMVVVAVLWFARENSEFLRVEAFGINVYNTMSIVLISVIGINIGKWLFTRFPVPGFTSLFLNT